MRIDYLFPNRINSESNANRFFFNCWTLQTTDNCAFIKKYKCELIIFFSNRNNSESNTNRFFFLKKWIESFSIKYDSSFFFQIEWIQNQMRIDFSNQMRIEFFFCESNQLCTECENRFSFCVLNYFRIKCESIFANQMRIESIPHQLRFDFLFENQIDPK